MGKSLIILDNYLDDLRRTWATGIEKGLAKDLLALRRAAQDA